MTTWIQFSCLHVSVAVKLHFASANLQLWMIVLFNCYIIILYRAILKWFICHKDITFGSKAIQWCSIYNGIWFVSFEHSIKLKWLPFHFFRRNRADIAKCIGPGDGRDFSQCFHQIFSIFIFNFIFSNILNNNKCFAET